MIESIPAQHGKAFAMLSFSPVPAGHFLCAVCRAVTPDSDMREVPGPVAGMPLYECSACATPVNVMPNVGITTLVRFMADQGYHNSAIDTYIADCHRGGEANPIGPITHIAYNVATGLYTITLATEDDSDDYHAGNWGWVQ